MLEQTIYGTMLAILSFHIGFYFAIGCLTGAVWFMLVFMLVGDIFDSIRGTRRKK